ncbi:MAG: hypothetical protein R2709_09070 [Marmoricola sp.]
MADLLTEIRRQLKPLGRQAEVARKAATVQAEARDAKARLLADDLATAQEALAKGIADESILVTGTPRWRASSRLCETKKPLWSRRYVEDLPALNKAHEVFHGLTAVRERIKSTASLAAERVRNSHNQPEVPQGRDPDELEAQAQAISSQESRDRRVSAKVTKPP